MHSAYNHLSTGPSVGLKNSSVEDVTAFVLTGGRSSRMGTDKAMLAWGGELLIERTLAVARRACGRVQICGQRERYAEFGEVIEDAEPGRGPLSGIQAALHATESELNLVLSVDLPLMRAGFLTWLLQQAREGEQKITVPDAGGNLQPLCAVYHREVAGVVDEAMAKGELKVTRLFRRAATRIIGEQEIRAAGFEPSIFTNVNTPEDYESLLQLAFETGHE
jgi:molybdopterin-guanine dinucleotide biosynthesis protein A